MFVCSHKFSVEVILIIGAHCQIHVFIAGSSNLHQTNPYLLVNLSNPIFTTCTFGSIPHQTKQTETHTHKIKQSKPSHSLQVEVAHGSHQQSMQLLPPGLPFKRLTGIAQGLTRYVQSFFV